MTLLLSLSTGSFSVDFVIEFLDNSMNLLPYYPTLLFILSYVYFIRSQERSRNLIKLCKISIVLVSNTNRDPRKGFDNKLYVKSSVFVPKTLLVNNLSVLPGDSYR